jgi:hypothetical protein
MAALVLSEIPDHINTYERLAVWAVQCCQSIANGIEVSVIDNQMAQPAAQAQLAVTADGVDRFILTAYIPVDRNELNSDSEKTWMAAKSLGTNQPHQNMMSN